MVFNNRTRKLLETINVIIDESSEFPPKDELGLEDEIPYRKKKKDKGTLIPDQLASSAPHNGSPSQLQENRDDLVTLPYIPPMAREPSSRVKLNHSPMVVSIVSCTKKFRNVRTYWKCSKIIKYSHVLDKLHCIIQYVGPK